MYDNQHKTRTTVVTTDPPEEKRPQLQGHLTSTGGSKAEYEASDEGSPEEGIGSTDSMDHQLMLSISGQKRKTLFILIDNPGLSIKEVAETLGVTHTTAGRHLKSLCDLQLVLREKEGSMERHYAVSAEEPKQLSWLRVTIQDVKRYAIIEYLVDNRRMESTVNKIANGVNVHHGLLLRTLRQLEKHGFVEMVRPGGWFYVKVQPLLVEHWKAIHEGA